MPDPTIPDPTTVTTWPQAVVTIVLMLLSFILLDQAMRRLPLGTSYAIWTGIGAVGAAIIGIVQFNEPRDWPRLVCIGMIVAGIVGLKATSRA